MGGRGVPATGNIEVIVNSVLYHYHGKQANRLKHVYKKEHTVTGAEALALIQTKMKDLQDLKADLNEIFDKK